MSKSKPGLASKVRSHIKALENGKSEYKRADALMAEILEKLELGEEVIIGPGKKARLKDNFAGANSIFKGHFVKRYEIEVFEP